MYPEKIIITIIVKKFRITNKIIKNLADMLLNEGRISNVLLISYFDEHFLMLQRKN